MAARIYADVRGKPCPCGGAFSKRVPHPDDNQVIVPKCDQCEKYPSLFLIDVDIKDLNGAPDRVKIRSDQNNQRLDKISKVIFTLETIQKEIAEGSFDVRKYDSKASRDSFIFQNYYFDKYLPKYEGPTATKKMSPKGLKEKKGFFKRELLPYFGKKDITKLNSAEIKKFKDSYKTKFRTRDLALGELKALLNEAVEDGLIVIPPRFEPIPRAKQRTQVIDHSVAIDTIPFILKRVYREMFEILTSYILRQCELTALTWDKVDFVKEEFTIDCHHSDGIVIPGRKSISEGERASMTYKMTPRVKQIFLERLPSKVVSMNWKSQPVFLNQYGNVVSVESLRDSWARARKRAGHTHQAYECRHATATAFSVKFNGNLNKLKVTGGWTSLAMLDRYVHEKNDMEGLG